MNKSNIVNFQGTDYFDDRLFVLYLCKGTVEVEPEPDAAVWTRIYHEEAPADHIWCVVTYRNCNRYPLRRVDSFHKNEDAEQYMKEIEPETPLISLDGNPPKSPFSYEEYSKWKAENGFKDYNWKSLYSPDGKNSCESIGQTKEQFRGIK